MAAVRACMAGPRRRKGAACAAGKKEGGGEPAIRGSVGTSKEEYQRAEGEALPVIRQASVAAPVDRGDGEVAQEGRGASPVVDHPPVREPALRRVDAGDMLQADGGEAAGEARDHRLARAGG